MSLSPLHFKISFRRIPRTPLLVVIFPVPRGVPHMLGTLEIFVRWRKGLIKFTANTDGNVGGRDCLLTQKFEPVGTGLHRDSAMLYLPQMALGNPTVRVKIRRAELSL